MIFTNEQELINTIRSVIREELDRANEKKQEKLYTLEEVLKIFSISVGTLHTWRKEGRIKPIKVGRRPLFSQEEIDRVKIAFKR